MRILLVSPRLPDRIQNGGDQWLSSIIASLERAGHDVTVLGYAEAKDSGGSPSVAVKIGEIRTRAAPFRALLWGFLCLVLHRPYSVQKWRTRRFRRALRKLMTQGWWELAVVYTAGMSWILDELASLPVVHLSSEPTHVLHDLEARRTGGIARLVHAREAKLLLREERKLVKLAAQTWCISEIDATHFRRLGSGTVRALTPLCRSDWNKAKQPALIKYDLVCLGNWLWRPNAEALRNFIANVVPLLPKSWRIAIGGAVAETRMVLPENVVLLGPVECACTFLSEGRRIAVPSTSEVGFNLKLLDAIAAMRPVVAAESSLRLAGALPSHVRGASEPRAFADALLAAPDPDPAEVAQWMAARQDALDQAVVECLSEISLPGSGKT